MRIGILKLYNGIARPFVTNMIHWSELSIDGFI